jgi:hypothetical protein
MYARTCVCVCVLVCVCVCVRVCVRVRWWSAKKTVQQLLGFGRDLVLEAYSALPKVGGAKHTPTHVHA